MKGHADRHAAAPLIVGAPDSDTPLDSAARDLRAHPGFRGAVEAYAAADLARYATLSLVERWMLSDMGGASLSGTVIALEGLSRLTAKSLMTSRPVATGEVSAGRARLYLQRAMANGLIAPVASTSPPTRTTPLASSPRFRKVMSDMLSMILHALTPLAPEAASAIEGTDDLEFLRRVASIGMLIAAHPERFPLDSTVQVFAARKSGMRILLHLISSQAPERDRILERCAYSHSSLARVGDCSRVHVIQLLQDGSQRGVLRLEPGHLVIAPELSEDVERYFANLFALAQASVRNVLADS